MRNLLLASASAIVLFAAVPAHAAQDDMAPIQVAEAAAPAAPAPAAAAPAAKATKKAKAKTAAPAKAAAKTPTKVNTLQSLDAQIQSLQAQVDTLKAGAGDTGVKITMNPSPKIESGEFSFQPFGRVHFDAGFAEDGGRSIANGVSFRRARLGAQGTIGGGFGYKAELDFAGSAVKSRDTYLNYTGIKNLELRVGTFKPFLGLEEQTSSNYSTFIENSVSTTAFVVGEVLGAGAIYSYGQGVAQLGVFNTTDGAAGTQDEAVSVVGRATYAPINDKDATIHVGAAGDYRKPAKSSGNSSFTFGTKAENTLQAQNSVSTGTISYADSAVLYGAELAGVYGPFSLQGEYTGAHVERTNNQVEADYDGGYVQAAWTLTGERRPYNAKTGLFDRLVPAQPVSLKTGGLGAWELALRYSTVNLGDKLVIANGVNGGQLKNYTAGLNWYLNKNARLMFDYVKSTSGRYNSGAAGTAGATTNAYDKPSLYLMRAQVDF